MDITSNTWTEMAGDAVPEPPAALSPSALVEAMGHGKNKHDVDSVLFVFFSLAVGLVIRTVWNDVPLLKRWVPLPYTVVIFLIGLAWGYVTLSGSTDTDLDDALNQILPMDPHLLLTIFIPPLLLESGIALNVHVFRRVMNQCLWLAFPGVAVSIGLSAVVSKYVYPDGWDWNSCALFGAIVSATDPVAVSALLKELGAPESLATVIEGESLFNDGTAFVLFTVFLKNAEETQSFSQVASTLARMAIGGAGFGILMGLITVLLLRYNYRRCDMFFEAAVTLVVPYLTFWTAENPLELSGVLAVVCMAVITNRYGHFYIRYHHALHHFWHHMSWFANTLVFMISGALVGAMIYDRRDMLHPGYQIVNYCFMNLIRALVIFGSLPLLSRLGYGFDLKQATVATWGGLRGAVGLAMGIIVLEDKHLDEGFREQIFDYVAFLVLFTLVINGTSSGCLLRWLKYDCKSATRIQLADKAREGVIAHGSGWLMDKTSDKATWDCQLAQWDLVKQDLDELDANSTAAFSQFRSLDHSDIGENVRQGDCSWAGVRQVKELLLLLFTRQLAALSHKDVLDPEALLIIQAAPPDGVC